MEGDVDAICEKLDELLNEFLLEWSKYRILMTSFSTSMKNGFLSVSKARYSMGVNAVSELQVPEDEFQSLVEVRPLKNNHEETAQSRLYFEFFRSAPSKHVKAQNLQDVAASVGDFDGVRKRLISGKKNIPADEEINNEKKEGDSQKALATDTVQLPSDVRPDPLHWFGFLVPNSLRQGQNCFQNAVRNSVELANLKIKLNGIVKEYLLLKEKKHKLLTNVHTISSTSDTG